LDEIPARRFDLINAEQVFEHLPEPLDTLRHLSRGLKPGGLLRIGVPNGTGLKQSLAAWDWTAPKGSARSLNAVAPLEHLNCFTRTSLLVLAETAGLREASASHRVVVGEVPQTARKVGRKVARSLLDRAGRRRLSASIAVVLTTDS
jgi:SAM-dependent methyltransferase